MNRKVQTLGFAIWALLAVPLLFAAYVGLAYRIALGSGNLPFLGSNEWRWYMGYFVALVSGILAVALMPVPKRWVRIALGVVYIGVMGVALAGISLAVSCVNGDCL